LKVAGEHARKLEIEILEREIVGLRGIVREQALKTYRKLLLSVLSEPIYLIISEKPRNGNLQLLYASGSQA